MKKSQLTVLIYGPEGSAEPFSVTVSSDSGKIQRAAMVHANEKAVFSLPQGSYRLRVRGGPAADPRGQNKWIRIREYSDLCLGFYFREIRCNPTAVVNFTVQDANYPDMIPINGGMTLWQEPAQL